MMARASKAWDSECFPCSLRPPSGPNRPLLRTGASAAFGCGMTLSGNFIDVARCPTSPAEIGRLDRGPRRNLLQSAVANASKQLCFSGALVVSLQLESICTKQLVSHRVG